MTITTFVHYGALDEAALKHPALTFYATYSKTFGEPNFFQNVSFDQFYADDAIQYDTDGKVIRGGRAIWAGYEELYKPVGQKHDTKSWIIVSDSEKGTHEIHVEMISTFQAPGRSDTLAIPRIFIYTVGKADEGKGTFGFQHRQIKSFWDKGELEKYVLHK
ncbi:hypothetical protein EXIGLDRAFT_719045 [Exidia glandulosa HHB12029]|uniref:SnoaL-like domain-containing protein n=1 Tax=Exidia glandulosa HHB12029 TaxID=1314781 RepID=A0A165HBZ3_EXIGL|nr:hypothetical protein EXIGLDRAFT_719045 [Exidia glandulosa HHB12029]